MAKLSIEKNIECELCIEEKPMRMIIECPFCRYGTCIKCTKKYLLQTNKCQCMNCGKEWMISFIGDKMPNSFFNSVYRKHRASIVLNKERSLLPATQPLVERRKQGEKIHQEMTKLKKQRSEITKTWRDITGKIRELEREIYHITRGEGEKEKEQKKFVRACPRANCRGFLSQNLKCGLCEKWSCGKCYEEKKGHIDEEHVCNEDTVKTIALIAKDSKPCPKCGEVIFKIDGCDQMFCIKCETAFSWRTGMAETGAIHNPHYYELLRSRNNGIIPRNQGDVPYANQCRDNLPRIFDLIVQCRKFHIDCEIVRHIHRCCNHLTEVTIPRYTREYVNTLPAYLQDLRIKYLMNTITEEKWVADIKKRTKQAEKSQEYSNILTMCTDMIRVFLMNIIQSTTREEIEKQLEELQYLRIYVNDKLMYTGRLYKNMYPQITSATEWVIREKDK